MPDNDLEPMRLGLVVSVGLGILRRHWAVVLILALLVAGPAALLTAATGVRFNEVALDLVPGLAEGTIDTGVTFSAAELDRLLQALLPYLGATLLAGVLGSVGALGFSAVVADDYYHRKPALEGALRACLRRLPGALVFMLITSLVVVGIVVLGLVGMSLATLVLPPASAAGGGPGVFIALVMAVAMVAALVYVTLRWAPAFPAMVIEGHGWRQAMRRSWQLSSDNVMRILAVTLLAFVISMALAAVLSSLLVLIVADVLAPTLGLDPLVAESVALALASVLVAPILPVLTAVLTFDLRVRRDLAAGSTGRHDSGS